MKILNRTTEATKTVSHRNTASEALAAYTLLKTTTSGETALATADSALNATVRGMTEKAVASGAVHDMTTGGEIENTAWSWTIDGSNENLLWLHETSSLLTETAPATVGKFSAPVAHVASATKITLRLDPFNITEIL